MRAAGDITILRPMGTSIVKCATMSHKSIKCEYTSEEENTTTMPLILHLKGRRRTQEGLGRRADIIYGRPPMLHLFLFCVRFFSLVVLRVPRASGLQSMHQHIHCGCCVIDAASRSRRSSCATPLCTFWVTESTIVLWNWINRGVI